MLSYLIISWFCGVQFITWIVSGRKMILFFLLQGLSAKLYSSLRMLRTNLVKEAADGVMAYHIFGRVLVLFYFALYCKDVSLKRWKIRNSTEYCLKVFTRESWTRFPILVD